MSRLVDMLFQYTLANRWVKPALAMTEMQACAEKNAEIAPRSRRDRAEIAPAR